LYTERSSDAKSEPKHRLGGTAIVEEEEEEEEEVLALLIELESFAESFGTFAFPAVVILGVEIVAAVFVAVVDFEEAVVVAVDGVVGLGATANSWTHVTNCLRLKQQCTSSTMSGFDCLFTSRPFIISSIAR
jgi:hypothetical protein